MTSLQASIYRSMLRICRKNDPELKNYLKTGLSTFKDNSEKFYNYKYIRGDKVFFIYGPYANDTANMLSYTKCMIQHGIKTDRTMERLFLAHRELPNFFIAKEIMEKKEQELFEDKETKNKIKLETRERVTSFGTAFY